MKRGRIYTVHYGDNVEVTRNFIKSILPYLNNSLDLVIINNSQNIQIDCIDNKYINIIDSAINRGYFGAIKYGFSIISIDKLDYVIVCNNDIVIDDNDFFNLLDKKIEDYDIIAPSIKTIYGVEQNPHRDRPITIYRKLYYKIYFLSYIIAFFINKLIEIKSIISNRKYISESSEKKIFSPHGAFIVFNKEYFNKGGIIDDGYFLYGEEDSIAAIAVINELTIGFVPRLKITHFESVSIGKRFSKKKFFYQKEAYDYIKKQYSQIFSI
jgi:GT2 family glycosyltransferase